MTIETEESGRPDPRLLLVVLFLSAVLRVAVVLAIDAPVEADGQHYLAMAQNFLAGRGIVDEHANLAFYNVGYPILVVAPAMAAGGSLTGVRAANVAMGLLSVLLCAHIAARLGAGRWGRLLAAAAYGAYLPAAVYADYIAKENLMTPLMLGVVWSALRLAKRPGWPTAWSAACCSAHWRSLATQPCHCSRLPLSRWRWHLAGVRCGLVSSCAPLE